MLTRLLTMPQAIGIGGGGGGGGVIIRRRDNRRRRKWCAGGRESRTRGSSTKRLIIESTIVDGFHGRDPEEHFDFKGDEGPHAKIRVLDALELGNYEGLALFAS